MAEVFEKRVVTTINTEYRGIKHGFVEQKMDGSEQAYIDGKKVSMQEYETYLNMSRQEQQKKYYKYKTTTYVNEETTFDKDGKKISVV